MLPTVWIIDMYNLFIIIGVIVCLYLVHLYARKVKMSEKLEYTYLLVGVIAIVAGIVFAVLFQSIFDLLEGNSSRPFAMTFYGGLFGGALTFILLYFFYIKKRYPEANLEHLLIIAPAGITVAHGFGRIGCFFAGCCYGVETDSWLGIQFPHLHDPVYPTQLFEAIFLLLLTGVLFYLGYKKLNKYTMPIYLGAYGVWRFLIEFIRGDDRGAYFLNLSPSQWFSLLALLGSAVLFVLITRKKFMTSSPVNELV